MNGKMGLYLSIGCIFSTSCVYSQVMNEFPAKSKEQVTLMNWAEAPYNRWGFRNATILPSVSVPRSGNIVALPKNQNANIDLTFEYQNKTHSVLDALHDDFTDGFIVFKNDKLVYEGYFDGFTEQDHHIWMSATKSMVSTALGILVDQGKIDLSKPISYYIPELEDSAFSTVSIQDALNMSTALDYSENYSGLKQGSINYEYFRRIGLMPAFDLMAQDPTESDIPRGVHSYLKNFKTKPSEEPNTVALLRNSHLEVKIPEWCYFNQLGKF